MFTNNIPILHRLQTHPEEAVEGRIGSAAFSCKLGIVNYAQNIIEHYSKLFDTNVQEICRASRIPHAFGFKHFGVIFDFASPTELSVHDKDLKLCAELDQLVEKYGVVVIRNAYMCAEHRKEMHMNIFPHLNFHRDRNDHHENKYTLFTRDPFNPDQKDPRPSSTLIVDNAVAHLQRLKEGGDKNEMGRHSHYVIFENETVTSLFQDVVFEIPWDAPSGTGEIGIINNRTVLHASYRKRVGDKGYPIGARYLF